jgi:signal transduction histidine kinase
MSKLSNIPSPTFSELLKAMPDLYLFLTPELIIIEATNAYLVATHTERKKIIGKLLFEIFPDNPDDINATGMKNLKASLDNVLRAKQPDSMAIQKYDVRLKVKNKLVYEVKYWSPMNTPILDKNGEVSYIIHRVEDVTALVKLQDREVKQARLTKALKSQTGIMEREVIKRAQDIQKANQKLILSNLELANKEQQQLILYQKLEATNQLKNQFFANVSHELRTPLGLILSILEKFMLDEALLGYQHDVSIIDKNARLLLKLVNELLDVSKLEAGKIQLNYFKSNLANVFKQVVSIFEAHASERKIEFNLHAPKVLMAEFDPDKIQRVIMNLLSNAFKFIPPNGVIRCELYESNAQAIMVISDNGPGILDKHKKQIFERFFQAHESSDRQHEGLGLGLAIVKDFVELHGGSVSVDKPREGSGAIFTIAIPLSAPSAAIVQSDYEESDALSADVVSQIIRDLHHQEKVILLPRQEDASKENWPLILVIEDNLEMNQHITEILSKNYRIANAFNGQEGYELALSLNPDLIICDVMLPQLSGVQLLHEIRQHAELNDVPVVIVTAKIDHELSAKLLSAGAQDCLSKPFSQVELKARISNLVMLKKNNEEILQKNLELSSSNKELEAFSYSVSHDLRNPLSSIIGFSSLLLDGFELEPEVMEYLNHILVSGKRMEELINDLFALSQSLKSDLHVDMVNLSDMVTSVIKTFKVQESRRKVKAVIEKNILAYCDDHLIRIVFENLIGNAWKYSSKKSETIIEFGVLKDTHPIYYVRDNGAGFLQANATKLFTPFSRLHTEKEFPGSGVGLVIVKRIIERHGGRIWVESEINKGTTIYFTLAGERISKLEIK